MAERIQVELVDDIDGSRAQYTVTFALDGVTYEIDLSERNARDLRSTFERYIERARKAQETPRTTRQQEREERRVRQDNRKLTEQIRGAAQRSRERHKQEQAETPEAGQDPEQEQMLFDEQPTPEPSADRLAAAGTSAEERDESQGTESRGEGPQDGGSQDEGPQDEGPQDEGPQDEGPQDEGKPRVPAVSLPHFSSAE